MCDKTPENWCETLGGVDTVGILDLPQEVLENIAIHLQDLRDWGSFIRTCSKINSINTFFLQNYMFKLFLKHHRETKIYRRGDEREEIIEPVTKIIKEYYTTNNEGKRHHYYTKYSSRGESFRFLKSGRYYLGGKRGRWLNLLPDRGFDCFTEICNYEKGKKHGLAKIYYGGEFYGAGIYVDGNPKYLWKMSILERPFEDAIECIEDVEKYKQPPKRSIFSNSPVLWTTNRSKIGYGDRVEFSTDNPIGRTVRDNLMKYTKHSNYIFLWEIKQSDPKVVDYHHREEGSVSNTHFLADEETNLKEM
jgi:antitoxin component YwqK of YwqJK toxin-antitoxin module